MNFDVQAQTTFVVNPNSMQKQLFSNNMSLKIALNNVQNSKLNVNLARAKLFPTLDLGVLLSSVISQNFVAATVSFLFPFLIPSNWSTLKQEKNLFEADKSSYKALQLNILGNSLSLYYLSLMDQKVKNSIEAQVAVLYKLYTILKNQSDILGNVTSQDLDLALASWQESKIRVSKLEILLAQERTEMRTVLGLPLNTEIKFEDHVLSPSAFEDKSPSEIAEYAYLVSPEALQLNSLVKAAKSGKFAKFFGFISSASLSGNATEESSAFHNLKASGGFKFGVDSFVNIKIANNSIDAISLRVSELKLENEKVSEIITDTLDEVLIQQQLSESALNSRVNVYQGQKRQFDLGLISLQTLLQTESQLTDAKISKLKTEGDLIMQRLLLKRLVIEDDFAKIKGCVEAPIVERKGFLSKSFRKIFGHKRKKISLDTLCQG